MPEASEGDISSQIKILSGEPAHQQTPTPDSDLDNLIRVGEPEATRRRLQREMPRPENTNLLGERDGNFEEVFIEGSTLEQMTAHLRSNLQVELGGALIGHFCEDPRTGRRFTQVTGFVADSQGTSRGGTFTFTPESWTEINGAVDQRARGESVLGWVHSHPLNYPPAPSGMDQFIMRHFFEQPEQITLILGRGGEYDNKYGLWRFQDNNVSMQRGMNIVGGDPQTVRNTSMYSLGEAQQEPSQAKKVDEKWFRKSLNGLFRLLGVNMSAKLKGQIDSVLAITPDDLIDDVAEIVVSTKKDENELIKDLEQSIRILKTGVDPEKDLLDMIKIGSTEEDVLKITSEDLVAPLTPQPTIKITQDLRKLAEIEAN